MRPSPGLIASAKEVFSRTTVAAVSGETRGGASKLVRPAFKHPHGFAHSTPHSHAQVRYASTTAKSSWRKSVEEFVECVYGGTFKALRSSVHARPGPYTSSRLTPHPRPVNARFTHSSPRPVPPRTHFGPLPRPSLGHSSTRMGLGTARQFSTGGFGVWDNVVLNVPLALRAAADRVDEGIDGRKWKRVKREIRRETRGQKGVGREPAGFDARREKREEFERYFGVQEEQVAEEREKEEKPVTLILALDPDFDLPLPLSSSSSPEIERLLSPSLLDSLASLSHAYSTHTHRLRTIVNRLNAAGLLDPSSGTHSSLAVLDPEADGVDEEPEGRRVWRVEFRDGLVTRSRVERVVRGSEAESREREGEVPHWAEKVQRWTGRNAVEAGEGEWWWLVGGAKPQAVVEPEEEDVLASTPPLPGSLLASPTLASTPSYPLSSSGDGEDYAIDAGAALAVAQTFVLPSPGSLSFSDSSSSSSSGEAEDTEDEEAVVWDLSTSLTETEPETNDLTDPAASVWASTDDARTSSGSALSYEDELRGFLSEVEGERERRFVEGMVSV
ncbi:hypothetical protein NBRC10512_006320 [Rhodotorula toruloides]|uniref:RHTO0S07e02894g1_1 n=2 Tax=Rhodotorula toruloides TaxID=5286 RepID=A0A061B710_RHOTO|nr:uncharacterized protein RHTO_02791 [Rhodotorula toruloides NP11]EMS25064.1 hypothetical protein RHTO_02791 [Rhodotorula toruloides NP11]CDR42680.1 RHTO0S07e02894g1_1 [Rhodotorula toruloides]